MPHVAVTATAPKGPVNQMGMQTRTLWYFGIVGIFFGGFFTTLFPVYLARPKRGTAINIAKTTITDLFIGLLHTIY